MKKFRLANIIKIIYVLLAIGGIITFWVVSKEINNIVAIRFVVAYIIFLLVSVLYMMGMSLIRLKNLKWSEVKNRLIRFIMIGIAFSTLNYCADYFFMPDRIDLLKNISIAFGSSFGINFFDLIYSKSKGIERIQK